MWARTVAALGKRRKKANLHFLQLHFLQLHFLQLHFLQLHFLQLLFRARSYNRLSAETKALTKGREVQPFFNRSLPMLN